LGELLDDFGDLEDCLVLAMAADRVDALFGFVTDRGNFVGLDIGLKDLGGDFSFVDQWGADLYGVAVDHQQGLEVDALAWRLEKFDFNNLALGDDILFATGSYYGFFHIRVA